MKHLVKVKDSQFGAITCNFYSDGTGEFFMTRLQIGQALEYVDPQWAIDKIHKAHKERLDKFSVTTKLVAADGKRYETYLYSAKGIYEICRWSRQPKADEFYDHVYDILEGLRLGYLKLDVEHNSLYWQQTRLASKDIRKLEIQGIKELVEYAKAQGSNHADRYYMVLSKLANKIVEIEANSRNKVSVGQLNNLMLVEYIICEVIKDGMQKGAYYKDIYAECKNRIEQFRVIAYLQDYKG